MNTPGISRRPVRLKRIRRKLVTASAIRFVRYRGRKGLAAIQRDGDHVGRLRYHLAVSQRRKLKHQLGRLFGMRPDDPDIAAWLKQAYRINDRAVWEVLAKASGAVTADEVDGSASVYGGEALVAQLESGRGAVLLGMHSGNVLAMLFKLGRSGLPISVIAHQPGRIADGFFEDFFRDSNVEVIRARPESRAYYKLNKAVQRGRAVYIPIDQIHKSAGIPARFLDKDVPMPGGAPALARRYGVPVYPVFLEAAEPEWRFRIEPGIDLPAGQEKQQDVADLVAIVDARIRQHPQLWSWHHRRWMRYPFERIS